MMYDYNMDTVISDSTPIRYPYNKNIIFEDPKVKKQTCHIWHNKRKNKKMKRLLVLIIMLVGVSAMCADVKSVTAPVDDGGWVPLLMGALPVAVVWVLHWIKMSKYNKLLKKVGAVIFEGTELGGGITELLLNPTTDNVDTVIACAKDVVVVAKNEFDFHKKRSKKYDKEFVHGDVEAFGHPGLPKNSK
jgi:K+ transporter